MGEFGGQVIETEVTLIFHSSQKMKQEIMYYGATDEKTANKIDLLWINIMKDYEKIFSNISYIEAANSGHYIHLTDSELVENQI